MSSAKEEEVQCINAVPSDPLVDKSAPRNLDEFLTLGRYTILLLLTVELLHLATISNMFYMIYAGASPTVVGCSEHELADAETACASLANLRNATNCEPRLKSQFHSVNIEFDYLCGASKIVKSTISAQLTGVLMGSLVFGQLSDMYGRRFVLLICMAFCTVFTAATALSTDIWTFTIIRIIAGFFTGGTSAVQTVFLVENIPAKYRLLFSNLFCWSFNFITFPIIAYYSGDWRTLALVAAGIHVIAAVFLGACYESPRFLLQHGNTEEAGRVLAAIRKINREHCERNAAEVKAMLMHESEEFEKRQHLLRKHTILDLLHPWEMFKWTMTLCFGVATTSLVNYGILFNMEKLSGSMYLNNILFGIFRWSLGLAFGFLDVKIPALGRKSVNVFAELFNITCIGLIFGTYWLGVQAEYAIIIRVCSVAGITMCAQLYNCEFATAMELFPTSVRNIAMSALAMSSRIGSIFAPILFYLAEIHPSYPYIALLAFMIIDIVGFHVNMPETKGKLLENHLPPRATRNAKNDAEQ